MRAGQHVIITPHLDYLGLLGNNLSFVDERLFCAPVSHLTKGSLKEADTRAGEWVVIPGAGGLGHGHRPRRTILYRLLPRGL